MNNCILTSDLIDDTVRLIEGGFNPSDAAYYLGYSYVTFKRWYSLGKRRLTKTRNRDSDALYIQFYVRISKAKAEAIRSLLQTIRDAGKEDWKAAAFLLTRYDKQQEKRMLQQTSEESIRNLVMTVARQVADGLKGDVCEDSGILGNGVAG